MKNIILIIILIFFSINLKATTNSNPFVSTQLEFSCKNLNPNSHRIPSGSILYNNPTDTRVNASVALQKLFVFGEDFSSNPSIIEVLKDKKIDDIEVTCSDNKINIMFLVFDLEEKKRKAFFFSVEKENDLISIKKYKEITQFNEDKMEEFIERLNFNFDNKYLDLKKTIDFECPNLDIENKGKFITHLSGGEFNILSITGFNKEFINNIEVKNLKNFYPMFVAPCLRSYYRKDMAFMILGADISTHENPKIFRGYHYLYLDSNGDARIKTINYDQ